MESRQSDDADDGTGRTDRGSAARRVALGAAAALGLVAVVVLWYGFAHGEDGYVTWSRREAAGGPEDVVVPTLSRSSDTDDIAPPF